MSSPAAGGVTASRLALKQTPLDTWSTREHLALASAVLRTGDQNWMSVSRAMRGFADRGRPPDWFSQKNCAQQYARLLELVDTPRRKRERGETNDSPGESIARRLRQDRADELRRQVTETRAAYTALKAQIRQLRSGQLDAKLDEIQREIQAEKEAAAKEKERQRQWLADREAQKLAVQQALRAQVTKAPPPKRRKLTLDRRESSPSETGSVLSEPDFADSPASEPQTAEASGDETSRDAAEQRPAPASPLLTSLLRSPTGGRPAAAAAGPEPAASGPPAGSPTLSRLLELPAGTPAATGRALPRLNLFPEPKLEQNGETAAGEQKAVAEVKAERGETETVEETPAEPSLPPPPPPPPAPASAPAPAPAVEQPEPPAQPAEAAETEVKSEPMVEEVDSATEEPTEEADGAAVEPTPAPAPASAPAPAPAPVPAPAADPTAIVDTTAAATKAVTSDTDTAAASAVTGEEPATVPQPAQDPPPGRKPAASEPESETAPGSADVESTPVSESALTEPEPVTEPEPKSEPKSQPNSQPKSQPASESAPAEAAPTPKPASVAGEVRGADGGGGGDAAAASVEPASAVVKQEPVDEEDEEKDGSETTAAPPATAAVPAKQAVSPAKHAPSPTKIAAVPAKDTAVPAKDTTVPAKDTAVPAKDSAVPAKDSAVPAKDSAVLAKDSAPVAEEPAPRPPPPPPLIKEEQRDESDAESAASAGPTSRARSVSARSEPAWHESVPSSPASAVLSGDDEERRDYKLWKKSIQLLWREFAAHRHASAFARPITNDQASNYRAVVRSPMDLAQLKRSVETGAVTSTPQFQRDLMLMFCNAMMFNASDHQVHRFALEMQSECVEKLQLLMQGDQQGGAASKRRETRESSRETREFSRETRESSREEMKRKRSGDDRPTPTRKRR